MITFDPEQFTFTPIRKVYTFHLKLTERFATESLRLTAAERSFLEPRLAIGKRWATVTVVIEDWRSHFVLKLNEGEPYSIGDALEGKKQAEHGGSSWEYERRSRQESIYACDFDGELDVWRRYLSKAQQEYMSLDVVEWWTLRLCALGGRFGSSWLPDRLEP